MPAVGSAIRAAVKFGTDHPDFRWHAEVLNAPALVADEAFRREQTSWCRINSMRSIGLLVGDEPSVEIFVNRIECHVPKVSFLCGPSSSGWWPWRQLKMRRRDVDGSRMHVVVTTLWLAGSFDASAEPTAKDQTNTSHHQEGHSERMGIETIHWLHGILFLRLGLREETDIHVWLAFDIQRRRTFFGRCE